MSTSNRRGPWSQVEDAYLVQLVHTQGALNWVRIANHIGSRSPKQCRERYHQNLKPSLNHEPISPEEGMQIERLVAELGKRWADIARRLHGRSDNAVKNWWNGSMNRRRRLVLRRKNSSQQQQHQSNFENHSSYTRSEHQPLSITSSSYSSRRMDGPLPSPATSQASRAESVDGAPSLISDTSSAFSISPRLAASPSLELPPLHSFSHDSRRPSLPTLPSRPNGYFEPETTSSYTFNSRYANEPKTHQLTVLAPPMYQQSQSYSQVAPSSPYSPGYYPEPRSYILTAPPTPVQLPPLQLAAPCQERVEPVKARDSRMNLNSLLG